MQALIIFGCLGIGLGGIVLIVLLASRQEHKEKWKYNSFLDLMKPEEFHIWTLHKVKKDKDYSGVPTYIFQRKAQIPRLNLDWETFWLYAKRIDGTWYYSIDVDVTSFFDPAYSIEASPEIAKRLEELSANFAINQKGIKQ